MKASIEGWKLWGKEKEYPILTLRCSSAEIEETKALCRLNQICKGLSGFGYKKSLAAINNPDAVKNQGTSFVIDLGTLLTLLAEVEVNKASKEFSVNWLRSLADKITNKKDVKVEEFTCRCGQAFKKEKVYKSHQKLCSIIAQDFGLMLRVQESLKVLAKDQKGKVHSNGKAKETKRVHIYSETHELRSKVSARPKGKLKQKKVHRRK